MNRSGKKFAMLGPNPKELQKEKAHREAALALAKDRKAALLLQMRMSDISEGFYCAYWMLGLEYDLWTIITTDHRKYGESEVTEDEVAELKSLSEQCGGWWYWDDKNGGTFVTLDQWATMRSK